MLLDKVHDLQSVFRKLLTAFSFPGRVMTLADTISRMDDDLPFVSHLILPALVLLDAETSFSVISDQSDVHSRLLSQLTYARCTSPREADFLFVTAGESNIRYALTEAREGTLEDPHLGATIVLETDFLDSDDPGNEPLQKLSAASPPEGLRRWELTGPGIISKRLIQVGGMDTWNHLRTDRNREFPLGVDMILVEPQGRVAALPRTTRTGESR